MTNSTFKACVEVKEKADGTFKEILDPSSPSGRTITMIDIDIAPGIPFIIDRGSKETYIVLADQEGA